MLALKSAETQAIAQLESECLRLAQEEARQTAANASTAAEVCTLQAFVCQRSPGHRLPPLPMPWSKLRIHSSRLSLSRVRAFRPALALTRTALSALRVAFEEANRTLTEEIERTIDAGSRKTPLALGTVSASTASSAESDFANNNTELTRLQQVYAPLRALGIGLTVMRS